MRAEPALDSLGTETLAHYRQLWALEAVEPGFETNSAWLQRVRMKGVASVLKCAKPESDERPGMALLAWWGSLQRQSQPQPQPQARNSGAVRVLRRDEDALVMAQACETPALGDPAAFDDQTADTILIKTALALHDSEASSVPFPPGLVPLTAVREHVFGLSAVAEACFQRWRGFALSLDVMGAAPEPLHGDIHHGNVLQDAETGGWVVIDPKGLYGHWAYDFANLFFNPMDQPERVAEPERMSGLASRIATLSAGRLDRSVVLDFAYLYGGMSLLWGWEEAWSSERLAQFQMLEKLWQQTP